MKKTIAAVLSLFIAVLIFSSFAANNVADVYMTRTGHIWFFSHSQMEDIEAHNYQASSALNTKTGEMVYSVLIKGFQFKKDLMRKHFNENYLHSEKYPKSTFSGKVLNIDKIDFSKNGKYEVEVEGDLMIHNITKKVKAPGTLEVKDGTISGKSKFKVRVKDYNIEIPALVKDNIAEVVDVNVDLTYKPKGK